LKYVYKLECPDFQWHLRTAAVKPRCVGVVPCTKNSMTIMRLPQHEHGAGQMRGPVSAPIAVFGVSWGKANGLWHGEQLAR
jgi:hypothetical protein